MAFSNIHEALGPQGHYGRWLRERPAIAQIADSVFLHGGIHPELESLKLEEINRRIGREIEAFDAYTEEMVRRRLILPFSSLQERVAAAQAELARLQPKGPAGETQNVVQLLEGFLGFGNWLSVRPGWPPVVQGIRPVVRAGRQGASEGIVGEPQGQAFRGRPYAPASGTDPGTL